MLAGSIVPVFGLIFPHPQTIVAVGLLALTSLSLDLVRFRLPALNRSFMRYLSPLLKSDEGHHITGATYMLIAGFIAFIFFSREIAVVCMLFLSLGDPAAALVGKRAAGPRFFGKSPIGTGAFFLVSLLVVAGLVKGGAVEYHWSLLAGAGIAAVVELVPSRLDDNLTIPLVSGAVMHALYL